MKYENDYHFKNSKINDLRKKIKALYWLATLLGKEMPCLAVKPIETFVFHL